MKKIFLLVLLLSIALPGCRKKNACLPCKTSCKTPVVETVGARTGNKTLSEQTDEFALEDDASFNVFEDESKKKIEPAGSEQEIAWEDVANEGEFERVQFDYDSTSINPTEKGKIKRNAQKIKTKLEGNNGQQVTITVEGNSCKIAKNPSHNCAVAQERAYVVAQEYENEGIPAKNIKSVGFGATKLLTEEDGMEAQSINRRTETVIK